VNSEQITFIVGAVLRTQELHPYLRVGVEQPSAFIPDLPRALAQHGYPIEAAIWEWAAQHYEVSGSLPPPNLITGAVGAELVMNPTAGFLGGFQGELDKELNERVDYWAGPIFENVDLKSAKSTIENVLIEFLVDRPSIQMHSMQQQGGIFPPVERERIRKIEREIEEARDFRAEPRGPFATAKFRDLVQEREEIVTGVLVAQQLAVIGAATKSLKTLVALDMAISIATGTPWLGYPPWSVSKARRVGFFSAESGAETLLRKHDVIAAKKLTRLAGGEPAAFRSRLDANLLWDTTLPDLGNRASVEAMRRMIKENGIEVLFLDPLSFAIGSAAKDLANLAIGGQVLMGAADACRRENCTLVLIHHTSGDRLRKHGAQSRAPLELTDLAYPAISNHARQWIAINRAADYDQETRCNELWLNIGGSGLQAGGIFYAMITEGQNHDLWTVNVQRHSAHLERQREREVEQRLQQEHDHSRRVLQFIIQAGSQGASITRMSRDQTTLQGIGHSKVTAAIEMLQRRGSITTVDSNNGIRYIATSRSTEGAAANDDTPPP